ncbi:MAG TPA: LysR substrate-binding domain-containing protein [Trebonia sp.]|jgi:DNA-binding transcriptional LysR family regulator
MFTLAQLSSFVAVAEELHFGRAAARLHMTQPPLSRQIALLEHEVGVALLDRTSRSVRLTPAGRLFLTEARRILRLAEQTSLAVQRIPTGTGGTLVMGFTAVSVHGYVQSVLKRIGEQLPHVDLVLRELVTADQLEGISAGDIDLGFVRPPVTRAGITSRVVHSERLFLAIPADDPLAASGPLDVATLDGRPLVMYSPVESRYFYELMVGLVARARIRPRYTQYVSQAHTVLALVQAGVGLSVVPESATALHPDGVVFAELAQDQSPVVELAAAWRENADNPALHTVLRLLGVDAAPDGPAFGTGDRGAGEAGAEARQDPEGSAHTPASDGDA